MRTLDKIDYIGISIFLLLIGCSIGMSIQMNIDIKDNERVAIQHGAAHYDSITGKFEWNK